MTIQEFIPFWQGNPFRAFRLHTSRGTFSVDYPQQVGLTPDMRLAVPVEGKRVELLAFEEVTHCEVTGKPMDMAEAVEAIDPKLLGRNAQLLTEAMSSTGAEDKAGDDARPASDPGTAAFTASRTAEGIHFVQAELSSREGAPLFSTADTRWNVHGIERFENGTSLYLHHLDHPTVEQRIIIWPPDKGTFESFSEGKSLKKLRQELERRDARLAAKPEPVAEPKAKYLESIVPEYPPPFLVGEIEARGGDPRYLDPDRFQLVLDSQDPKAERPILNPAILDTLFEHVLLDLARTEWSTPSKPGQAPELLELRHASAARRSVKLHCDYQRRMATLDGESTDARFEFFQRNLFNFALHEKWDLLMAALKAGPIDEGVPEIVLPAPGGFRVELWPGDHRHVLPFLQPRIVGTDGRTVFDLRTTTWGAAVRIDAKAPVVTLRFVSGEREHAATSEFDVRIDLIRHCVTCPQLKGWTTVGMLQALVRHVRGVKWMAEDLPKWMAKSKGIPSPA